MTARRLAVLGDLSVAWLDDVLAGGMSTAEASRLLRRVWIPLLREASALDAAEDGRRARTAEP